MTHGVEVREKFIEARAQGQTLKKVSEDLDISYNTACGWNRDYKERIAASRAIYLEELKDKFYLSVESRLQLFGEQLEAVKAEIARRDLNDVPTHKLFEILIALHKALKEESVEPVFMTDEEAEERKTSRIAREEMNKALDIW